MLCPCHPWFSWSNLSSRDVFIRHMNNHQPRIDTSVYTTAWWKSTKPTAHSQIPFKCNQCGVVVESMIASVVNAGNHVRCGCSDIPQRGHKTASKLFEWLQDNFGSSVKREVCVCINSSTGRQLRMDFLVHGFICIELDGNIGHFGKDYRGKVATTKSGRQLTCEASSISSTILKLRPVMKTTMPPFS